MENPSRSIALDLLATDLDDHAALTAFLAAHAIAPAREPFRLPAPRAGETDDVLVYNVDGDFLVWTEESFGLGFRPTPARFDAFIAGCILLARLFPRAFEADLAEVVLAAPGPAMFERASILASLLWGDIAALAGGLLGVATAKPPNRALPGSYEPAPNDAALAELRAARQLVAAALHVPPEDPFSLDYVRINLGLRLMDAEPAAAIDAIVRRDARQRLIHLRDVELAWTMRDPEPSLRSFYVDRGVFPAVVPETISGVIALDLVRTLAVDPRTAACGLCGRPLLMSRSQAARSAQGEDVFHPDCRLERRRRYVRDYQRTRARAVAEPLVGSDARPTGTRGSERR